MAGLPEVIGLLYRADWTRLSLSAELRSETDREPLPRLSREGRSRWYRAWPGQRQDNGRYVGRGALLIGPGGRWRLECPVPGRGAEGEAAEGNDGERGWSWRPPEVGGPPPLPVKVGGAYPPPPELFCPSGLLGGFTLEVLGPVTVAGRDAIAVAAAPRRDVLGSGSAERPYDRIEVAVDAELGILLRRIETSGGELVTLTELTDVTMNPPEAADPARFAPPPGSHRGETLEENRRETLSGPGWAAADLAAGGLGALIRHVPHLLGHGAAGEQPEAMPSPDPAPLEPADGSPPPDEVLDLLYRSGEPRDLGATARQWLDLFAMAAPLPEGFRAAGRGGFGDLFDAMTRGTSRGPHGSPAARQRPGPVPPRLLVPPAPHRFDDDRLRRRAPLAGLPGPDPGRPGRPPAGPHRVPGRLVLAAPPPAVRRRGAHLPWPARPPAPRHSRPRRRGGGPGAADDLHHRPIVDAPTDAIVDAETGCLLRLISYSGDTLVIWSELDDISTEPADPDEFRVHVPPGTRIVEETGNLIADAAAAMPGVKGTAARAAAEAVNRTADAVSAARSFLDDLRGHR